MEVDLNREQISCYIPHRAPFLLVDRVTWLEPRKLGRGQKLVALEDPIFEGHFPGNPIFPGVLLIESLGQLGALLFSEPVALGESPSSSGKVLARVDRARFMRPIKPGEVVELEVKVLKEFEGFVKAEAHARVGTEAAVSAELTFTI